MAEIDWNAPAEVQSRQDGGSDMYYDFKPIRSGTLVEMIRWTMALDSEERKRVVIDAAGVGSINIHDINALAEREDFPAE
jgi:hypothetical protein